MPRSSVDVLEMEPCLHCGEPRRNWAAALVLRVRGCACPACGGDGVVPAIVHEAWSRGESGAQAWAEYWSALPRWRGWLGIQG